MVESFDTGVSKGDPNWQKLCFYIFEGNEN